MSQMKLENKEMGEMAKELKDYQYYHEDNPSIDIYCGDCLEILPLLEDKSIDLCLTDPPYGISNKVYREYGVDRSKFRSKIMRRKKAINFHFGEWDVWKTKEEFLEYTKKWLLGAIGVLKQNGTIISFFNKEDISYLNWEAYKQGIKTRTIFTWHKTNPVPSFRKVNYLSACEFIWIGSKGKMTFNFGYQKDMHNFFECPQCQGNDRTEHPTQKPLPLIKHFLEIHSKKSDLILDPFLGSGTTLVACKELGRCGIGIEISEEYSKVAVNRLKNTMRSMF